MALEFLNHTISNTSLSFGNDSSSTQVEVIGGLAYFLKYIGIYMPTTLLSTVGCFVGLIGNILIIGSVYTSRELRTNPTCILLCNLALADLFISVVVNVFTVLGILLGKSFFDRHMDLCALISGICLASCSSSLINMGLLSFNRYVCIFYHGSYNKVFSVKYTKIYCVIAWVLACIIISPNFYGVGGNAYDTKTLQCIFDRLKVGYTITFCVVCIYIPCIAIAFFYARIFWHAYSSKKRSLTESSQQSSLSKNQSLFSEAIKVAKSLFASFFLFACCWIPISVAFLAGFDDKLPIAAHVFTNLPAHLNSALNPIFYAVFNPKMKQGYARFLRLLICSSPKVTGSESKGHSVSALTVKCANNNICASPVSKASTLHN